MPIPLTIQLIEAALHVGAKVIHIRGDEEFEHPVQIRLADGTLVFAPNLLPDREGVYAELDFPINPDYAAGRIVFPNLTAEYQLSPVASTNAAGRSWVLIIHLGDAPPPPSDGPRPDIVVDHPIRPKVDEPDVLLKALLSAVAFDLHGGHIVPVSAYGYQLLLKPFQQNQHGFNWVKNLVAQANWLISSQKTEANEVELFLLEPSFLAKPTIGRLLYHVTPIANVQPILATGIEPRTGGTTWLGRTYPPRSHHALTLWDAMCFLDTTSSSQPSTCGPGILTMTDLLKYEILEVVPSDKHDFWLDAWMAGACWTEAKIPSESVSTSQKWRERYAMVAAWR